MPATLNLGNDYKLIDDRTSITITNPDTTAVTTSDAMQEESIENDIVQGEVGLELVQSRWHVYKARLSDTSFVPERDGYITDADGNIWRIDAVSLLTNDTRYEIETTLEANKALR